MRCWEDWQVGNLFNPFRQSHCEQEDAIADEANRLLHSDMRYSQHKVDSNMKLYDLKPLFNMVGKVFITEISKIRPNYMAFPYLVVTNLMCLQTQRSHVSTYNLTTTPGYKILSQHVSHSTNNPEYRISTLSLKIGAVCQSSSTRRSATLCFFIKLTGRGEGIAYAEEAQEQQLKVLNILNVQEKLRSRQKSNSAFEA